MSNISNMGKPMESEILALAQEVGIKIKDIPFNQGYWLVRTYHGMFYDTFKINGFVGVGWDWEEELCQRLNVTPQDEKYVALLALQERGKKAASKISRFMRDINVGDVVMIPASRSKVVLIGEVASEAYFVDEFPYPRRRDVNWIREVNWYDIPKQVSHFLMTQHGICSAYQILDEINRMAYPIHQRDGRAHIVIKVRKDKDIRATELSDFINLAVKIAASLEPNEVLTVKTELNSPGEVIFSAYSLPIIVCLALALWAVVGGKFQSKHEFQDKSGLKNHEFYFETEGIIKHLLEHKVQMQRVVQNLDIDTSLFLKEKNNHSGE